MNMVSIRVIYFWCYYLTLWAFLGDVFHNKTIFPLAFAGYEMGIANWVQCALLVGYHLMIQRALLEKLLTIDCFHLTSQQPY